MRSASPENPIAKIGEQMAKANDRVLDLFIEGLNNAAKYENTTAEGGVMFMAREADVDFAYGMSQEIVDEYVDNAYGKKNTDDYKKYADVSDRLLNDVKDEIDISDYAHALRDNDLRHISNSHGEKSGEKYPVTSDDLKAIPYITQYYDKVVVKKNQHGNQA